MTRTFLFQVQFCRVFIHKAFFSVCTWIDGKKKKEDEWHFFFLFVLTYIYVLENVEILIANNGLENLFKQKMRGLNVSLITTKHFFLKDSRNSILFLPFSNIFFFVLCLISCNVYLVVLFKILWREKKPLKILLFYTFYNHKNTFAK